MKRAGGIITALLLATLAGCGSGTAPPAPDSGAGVTAAPVRPVGAAPYTPPSTTAAGAPKSCANPDDGSVLPVTDAATAQIRQRGALVAGVDQNTFLMGYRNPASGDLEGFDIDVVHALAQAILGDPNKVTFRAISSADRIPVLQRDEVDVVVRTMSITCDRLQQVAFSNVYYDAGQRLLVHKRSGVSSMADLGGKKVCATSGSTSLDHIAQAASKPVPVAVPNWTDCLVMLQQNEVDAVSTDDTILAGLAAQDPNTEVVGAKFTDEPYGVAVTHNNHALAAVINGVLKDWRDSGQWQAAYQKRLGGLGPASPPDPVFRPKQ